MTKKHTATNLHGWGCYRYTENIVYSCDVTEEYHSYKMYVFVQ